MVSTASIERGGAGGARREVRKREREENANAVVLSESGYGFLHTRSFQLRRRKGRLAAGFPAVKASSARLRSRPTAHAEKMLLLFETPAGFSLFKVKDEGKLEDAEVRPPSRAQCPILTRFFLARCCFFALATARRLGIAVSRRARRRIDAVREARARSLFRPIEPHAVPDRSPSIARRAGRVRPPRA